jgi:LuxR family maltose regulon positive regulatory protein
VGIGQINYAWNNLDKSLEHLRKGIDFGKKAANSRILFLGHLALARALQTQGDASGALNIMQEAVKIWQQYNLSRWKLLPSVTAHQAWLSLVQGDIESAAQWAQKKGLDPQGELVYQYEGDFIILARLLVSQGDVDKAMELLLRLLESAEQGGRIAHCIEILSLQAISLNAQGKNDRAFSVLGKALAMAEPGGFVRVFIDEGPRMARLLYEISANADVLSSEISLDYVQRLLAAFPEIEPEQTSPSKVHSPDSEWIEPLTERELEVLQLIADGLTNAKIASKLYLSLNTVKAHTRSIYGKLDVNNRTQAAARARELGLITTD